MVVTYPIQNRRIRANPPAQTASAETDTQQGQAVNCEDRLCVLCPKSQRYSAGKNCHQFIPISVIF